MQLTPRYGPDPVLHLDGDPSAIGALVTRQRRRFLVALEALTDDQWTHPSRCEGWSSRDVALHVAGTNSYWELSIRSGIRGEPTEFMANFDPVVTPVRMVAGSEAGPAEILEMMATSTESLAACLAALSADDWTSLAESPPGHVTVSSVAHHALWDSWTHERDVLLPLGVSPIEEPDELLACLRYVTALTPALAVCGGGAGSGSFDVSVTDPDADFHVEIGDDVEVTAGATGSDFVLRGRAVDLIEALSFRRPLEHDVPDDMEWVFSGLGTAFDHEDE